MAYPDVSEEILKRVRMTRAQWNEHRTMMAKRDKDSPPVGAPAPDFELPYLDDPSKKAMLSEFKDRRPVGLIFGSYT